ncbi:hypothetical protein [Dietzia sp. 179-F 9C3 NHS]
MSRTTTASTYGPTRRRLPAALLLPAVAAVVAARVAGGRRG